MYQMKKLPFNYIPELRCRILELPYVGNELSMIILLPDTIEDETTGLQEVCLFHYSGTKYIYFFQYLICVFVMKIKNKTGFFYVASQKILDYFSFLIATRAHRIG